MDPRQQRLFSGRVEISNDIDIGHFTCLCSSCIGVRADEMFNTG
jgi:hypothetical protein